MICTSCNSITDDNSPRCYKCGRSLVVEGNRPGQRPGDQPRLTKANKYKYLDAMSSFIAYIIFGVLVAVVLGVFLLRCELRKTLRHGDVEIYSANFDIIKADPAFSELHGVENKLVVYIKVVNRGNVSVKKVDARIYLKSAKIEVWSKQGAFDGIFHLVQPPFSVPAGGEFTAMAEFPVRNSPFGLVKIEWDRTFLLVE